MTLRITGIALIVVALIGMVGACGCKTDMAGYIDDAAEGLKDRLNIEKPEPVEDGPVDDLDLSTVRWLGSDYSGAKVTTEHRSARIDRSFVYVDYAAYSWPAKDVGGARVDAICCLFYERDGAIVGGKYDWIRVGGQAKKVTHNLHNGYNGHTYPESGSVWECWVSVDGKERSNVREVAR